MMVHTVYNEKKMEELSQQELLKALKEALNSTWIGVSELTGIAPRTLKSYLLPETSKGRRGMDKFVRKAVEVALSQALKKKLSG